MAGTYREEAEQRRGGGNSEGKRKWQGDEIEAVLLGFFIGKQQAGEIGVRRAAKVFFSF